MRASAAGARRARRSSSWNSSPKYSAAVAHLRSTDVDAEPRCAVVVPHPDLGLGRRQLGLVPVQAQGALRRRLGTGVARAAPAPAADDAAVPLEAMRAPRAATSRGRRRAAGSRRSPRARRTSRAAGRGRKRSAGRRHRETAGILTSRGSQVAYRRCARRRVRILLLCRLKTSSERHLMDRRLRGSASTPWIQAAVRSTTTACSGTTSSSDATRRRERVGHLRRDEHAPQHGRSSPRSTTSAPQARVPRRPRGVSRRERTVDGQRARPVRAGSASSAPGRQDAACDHACPNPASGRVTSSTGRASDGHEVPGRRSQDAHEVPARRARTGTSARSGQKMISPALRRLRSRATASSRMSAASVSLRRSFT